MDQLKARGDAWVAENVAVCNQRELEIFWLRKKSLGLRLEFKKYTPLGYRHLSGIKFTDKQLPVSMINNGVWISGAKAGTGLAFALGGPEAYESGCAILAVNGQDCNSPEELKRLYLKARDKEKAVQLTLCLSRYANLINLPDISRINPRRIDGKRFTASEYNALSLEPIEAVEVTSSIFEKQTWIEYPEPGSPQTGLLPRKQADASKGVIDVLGDVKSVEVDLEIYGSQSLGAKLTYSDYLWLHDFKTGGQLVKTLGKEACKHGFLLWKANGQVLDRGVHGFDRFRKIKENARSGSFRVT